MNNILIFNSLGQEVSKQINITNISNNKVQLNVANLNRGTYLIRTEKGNTVCFVKY
jgi:hypothetical protein